MKTPLLITFIAVFLILTGCVESNQKIHTLNIEDFNDTHQVLLTNEAHFKKHTSLYGASSFLIDYNNTVYAITAKHLIGKAGGVEPEILPMDLPKTIDSWKMFPRVENKIANDTVTISNVNYKSIQTDADILLLKVKEGSSHLCKLKPNFELPKENDSLFILGCQYADEECRQSIYYCQYASFDAQSNMLIFELHKKIELPGFSGAPIIDRDGFVVAVLTTGWEENGKFYIGGTFIKEIDKFKY